jgi:transposase
VGEHTEAFVGIDAAKARNAIAVAEGGRGGEVRYLGEVDAAEPGMRRVVARIAAKYDRVHFCYGRSRRDRRPDWLRLAPAHCRPRA